MSVSSSSELSRLEGSVERGMFAESARANPFRAKRYYPLQSRPRKGEFLHSNYVPYYQHGRRMPLVSTPAQYVSTCCKEVWGYYPYDATPGFDAFGGQIYLLHSSSPRVRNGDSDIARMCYENMERIDSFYRNVFLENPVQRADLVMEAFLHDPLSTACWHPGNQAVRLNPTEIFQNPDTNLGLLAHEFGHAVTQYAMGAFKYEGESGALDESFADVSAIMVKHYQTRTLATAEADWEIGEGCYVSRVDGTRSALRNMLRPGTAFRNLYSLDVSTLKIRLQNNDSQPTTVAEYEALRREMRREGLLDSTSEKYHDLGGVHLFNSIPNRAFALSAIAIGDHTYGRPGQVWHHALTLARQEDCFSDFALKTLQACRELHYHNGVYNAIGQAWQQVGVDLRGRPPTIEADDYPEFISSNAANRPSLSEVAIRHLNSHPITRLEVFQLEELRHREAVIQELAAGRPVHVIEEDNHRNVFFLRGNQYTSRWDVISVPTLDDILYDQVYSWCDSVEVHLRGGGEVLPVPVLQAGRVIQSPDVAIAAIRRAGSALAKVKAHAEAHAGYVVPDSIVAVRNDIFSLVHMHDDCKDHRGVMLAAIKIDPSLYLKAGEELQNDLEFLKAAMVNTGFSVLKYVSADVRTRLVSSNINYKDAMWAQSPEGIPVKYAIIAYKPAMWVGDRLVRTVAWSGTGIVEAIESDCSCFRRPYDRFMVPIGYFQDKYWPQARWAFAPLADGKVPTVNGDTLCHPTFKNWLRDHRGETWRGWISGIRYGGKESGVDGKYASSLDINGRHYLLIPANGQTADEVEYTGYVPARSLEAAAKPLEYLRAHQLTADTCNFVVDKFGKLHIACALIDYRGHGFEFQDADRIWWPVGNGSYAAKRTNILANRDAAILELQALIVGRR